MAYIHQPKRLVARGGTVTVRTFDRKEPKLRELGASWVLAFVFPLFYGNCFFVFQNFARKYIDRIVGKTQDVSRDQKKTNVVTFDKILSSWF